MIVNSKICPKILLKILYTQFFCALDAKKAMQYHFAFNILLCNHYSAIGEKHLFVLLEFQADISSKLPAQCLN